MVLAFQQLGVHPGFSRHFPHPFGRARMRALTQAWAKLTMVSSTNWKGTIKRVYGAFIGCTSSRALRLFSFGIQSHFAHNINPTALFEVCLDAGRHCRTRLARHRLGMCFHSLGCCLSLGLGLGLALLLGFRRNGRPLTWRLLAQRIACMVVSHVFGMQGHPTQGGHGFF